MILLARMKLHSCRFRLAKKALNSCYNIHFVDSYLTSTLQIGQELRSGKSIYRQILMGVMVFNAIFNNISVISW
jgi:hypothetical protein